MRRRERSTQQHATLYARGDLPEPATERRNAVTKRLAELAADGALDAFDVVHWAKRVPAHGSPGRERSLLAAFHEWAANEGVSLSPCFQTRRCYAADTGKRRDEVVMPVLCLAVREGEELIEVTPHAGNAEVVTVSDSIRRLEGEIDAEEATGRGDHRKIESV